MIGVGLRPWLHWDHKDFKKTHVHGNTEAGSVHWLRAANYREASTSLQRRRTQHRLTGNANAAKAVGPKKAWLGLNGKARGGTRSTIVAGVPVHSKLSIRASIQ